MTILNQDIVQKQIPLVQAAIKKHLKVDSGKQAAYHIFAVSHFFKNDQQMKGSFDKAEYTLVANLGSEKAPFTVEHKLGSFKTDQEAIAAGEYSIRFCDMEADWKLHRNGESTNMGIFSQYSEPDKGYRLNLVAYDNSLEGLRETMSNICDQLEEGRCTGGVINGSSRYSFETKGDEYDPINDIDCIAPDNAYAIFDSKSIIISSDSEDDVYGAWNDREEEIDEWQDFLIYAQNIEVSDALEEDHCTYHAISRSTGTMYSGEIMDILDALQHENSEFSLFQEIERD